MLLPTVEPGSGPLRGWQVPRSGPPPRPAQGCAGRRCRLVERGPPRRQPNGSTHWQTKCRPMPTASLPRHRPTLVRIYVNHSYSREERDRGLTLAAPADFARHLTTATAGPAAQDKSSAHRVTAQHAPMGINTSRAPVAAGCKTRGGPGALHRAHPLFVASGKRKRGPRGPLLSEHPDHLVETTGGLDVIAS